MLTPRRVHFTLHTGELSVGQADRERGVDVLGRLRAPRTASGTPLESHLQRAERTWIETFLVDDACHGSANVVPIPGRTC